MCFSHHQPTGCVKEREIYVQLFSCPQRLPHAMSHLRPLSDGSCCLSCDPLSGGLFPKLGGSTPGMSPVHPPRHPCSLSTTSSLFELHSPALSNQLTWDSSWLVGLLCTWRQLPALIGRLVTHVRLGPTNRKQVLGSRASSSARYPSVNWRVLELLWYQRYDLSRGLSRLTFCYFFLFSFDQHILDGIVDCRVACSFISDGHFFLILGHWFTASLVPKAYLMNTRST